MVHWCPRQCPLAVLDEALGVCSCGQKVERVAILGTQQAPVPTDCSNGLDVHSDLEH
jgi:hypothetical protein